LTAILSATRKLSTGNKLQPFRLNCRKGFRFCNTSVF